MWTIPIVQSLNQRNFERHAARLAKASSYAEIAAAGRTFEEDRSGIGTGLIIGGLVGGFGAMILASRWLRATERQPH